MLNIKINKVLLTIPSYYAEFLMTDAKIDIVHENNLINGDDVGDSDNSGGSDSGGGDEEESFNF